MWVTVYIQYIYISFCTVLIPWHSHQSSPEVSTHPVTPFSTALQGYLLVSLSASVDAATRALTQALLVPAHGGAWPKQGGPGGPGLHFRHKKNGRTSVFSGDNIVIFIICYSKYGEYVNIIGHNDHNGIYDQCQIHSNTGFSGMPWLTIMVMSLYFT